MVSKNFEPQGVLIGELLNTATDALEVPAWQRSYSWGTEEVSTFWNDLIEFDQEFPGNAINKQEYFLGSTVIVRNNDGDDKTNTLLDGQQRLTTATILLSALRDTRAKIDSESANRIHSKHIIDIDDATNTAKPVLTLNLYDRSFFLTEVQNKPAVGTEPATPKQDSHKKIRKAREYLLSKVQEEMDAAWKEGGAEAAKQRGIRIQKVLLHHCALVAVYSNDEDNAASVFETLNDRGIGLSTTDLLRNYLLREAPDRSSREEIIQHWQSVFENTGQASADKFLRHYWLSKYGDVKSRRLYREIKDHVGKGKTPSLDFTRELNAESLTYRGIINCEDPNEEVAAALQDIKDLGAQVAYPLVMAALRTAADQDNETVRLLNFISTLFIRYQIICGYESSVLETAFYNAAKEVRTAKSLEPAYQILQPLLPPLTDFAASFSTAEVSRISIARTLLRRIEGHLQDSEELEIGSNRKVHLEHIYPKNPAGEQWHDHNRWVNRLGNLTLLGRRMNTSIRNSAFQIKKEKGYTDSDIHLTKMLLSYEKWDQISVIKRQQELALLAVPVFALPDEELPDPDETVAKISATIDASGIAPDAV